MESQVSKGQPAVANRERMADTIKAGVLIVIGYLYMAVCCA